MIDEWDDVLYRIEQEYGPAVAQYISDTIDEGDLESYKEYV